MIFWIKEKVSKNGSNEITVLLESKKTFCHPKPACVHVYGDQTKTSLDQEDQATTRTRKPRVARGAGGERTGGSRQ